MICATDRRIVESSAVARVNTLLRKQLKCLCSIKSQKKKKKKKTKKLVQLWSESCRDLEINGVQKLHVLYLS